MLSTELKYYLSGRGGIGRRASFRYSYLMVWEFKSPRPHKVIQGIYIESNLSELFFNNIFNYLV